ncbi:MAG: nucleotide-binding protein [Sulfuritalea sp.]|nr:nucleotide-binding protein [Sulfuritalea sp.]
MKALLTICMILATGTVFASAPPAPMPPGGAVLKGSVLEARNVDGYTYLRLKTNDGEAWAAVSKVAVKKGATVTIENTMVMNNFESKSLKKTFPKIVFGNLAGTGGSAKTPSAEMNKAHAGVSSAPAIGDVRVPKASGANAHTVAEIVTKSAALKNKPVLVRGKVVKYNPGIMGKNWIHLRDGSGSGTDGSNDILVTSTSAAKLGDVLTVKGIVNTDINLGSGYVYKVLIQEATLIH